VPPGWIQFLLYDRSTQRLANPAHVSLLSHPHRAIDSHDLVQRLCLRRTATMRSPSLKLPASRTFPNRLSIIFPQQGTPRSGRGRCLRGAPRRNDTGATAWNKTADAVRAGAHAAFGNQFFVFSSLPIVVSSVPSPQIGSPDRPLKQLRSFPLTPLPDAL
jgi:hypothetical protein